MVGKDEDTRPDCTTFEQYITYLFKHKKTDSKEFRVMLEIFGKEKLAKIWEKFNESGGK